MTEETSRRRRYPEAVVGSAVVVGLVVAVPVAILILVVPLFIQALNGGAGLMQAFGAMAITDEEDWELLPWFSIGALVIGALVATIAALVWSLVAAKVSKHPWAAQWVAALVAAGLPLLLLAWDSNWGVAVPAAMAAGLTTLIAVPRVGYDRPRPTPTRSATTTLA